jgi:hypothetical protein
MEIIKTLFIVLLAITVAVYGSTTLQLRQQQQQKSFPITGIMCISWKPDCFYVGIDPTLQQPNAFTIISRPIPEGKYWWNDLETFDYKNQIYYTSTALGIHAIDAKAGNVLYSYSTGTTNIYSITYDPTKNVVLTNLFNNLVAINVQTGQNYTVLEFTEDSHQGVGHSPLDTKTNTLFLSRIDSHGWSEIDLNKKTIKTYTTDYAVFFLFLDEQGELYSLTRNTTTGTADVIKLNRNNPSANPTYIMSIPDSISSAIYAASYNQQTHQYVIFQQTTPAGGSDYYIILDLKQRKVLYNIPFGNSQYMVNVHFGA